MKYVLELEGRLFEVDSSKELGSFDVQKVHANVYSILLDGRSFLVSLKEGSEFILDDGKQRYYLRIYRSALGKEGISHMHSKADVKAPIPGLVVDVLVNEGDRVNKGDTLVIVEAMKMRNHIKSPIDGTVRNVRVSKGSSVNANELLMTIEGS